MSRVFDALRRSCPDQVPPTAIPDNGHELFLEPIRNPVWDHDSAPIAEANFSCEDKITELFSAYGFASEQFRLLATRLQLIQQKRTLKSILLTSSAQHEGKSLLTVNLAMALAQGRRQKILVVDADLRNAGIGRTLRIEERSGIREWYRSSEPATDFICRLAGHNVWLLPAGQEAVDPLELLKSPRMSTLLTSMSAAFDWLLIDSAPLLPIADSEVISWIADGTILVVRREQSSKTELTQALARIAPSKMIGLLLNDFPASARYADYHTVGKHSGESRASHEANGF